MEIIPSVVYWAPGLDPCLRKRTLNYVNALEVGHSDGEVATYRVPHYGDAMLRAFGPFALDEILRFCRGVHSIVHFNTEVDIDEPLDRHFEHAVVAKLPLCLTTALGDSKAHTNACVLLGAYLILCENWSASEVANKLGKDDSERVFRGSWVESWVLKVSHCWEGLMAARDHGWIDLDCLRDDALLETTCEQFKTMAYTYDCAWLVPSKILVSADPITTLCDPNPQTFTGLWEDDDDVSTIASTRDTTTSSPCVSTDDSPARSEFPESDIPTFFHPMSCVEPSQSELEALHTPTKQCSYAERKTQSFRGFLQDCGVSLVIRNNLPGERGMPRESYDGVHWKTYDIEHIDLQFCDGAVPPQSVISSALSSSLSMLESDLGAILVHCKGGLGRSVTLACCLACYKYDIPGSALLGWARITRPGAFNTVRQEEFLLSLGGRVDILRLANKHRDGADLGAKVSCGCVLQ
jgi:hypothetical protein